MRTERPNCERPPRSEDGGEEGALEVEVEEGQQRVVAECRVANPTVDGRYQAGVEGGSGSWLLANKR